MMEELFSYSESDFASINALMAELSQSGSCSVGRLNKVLADGGSHLYVVRDDNGTIRACATLCMVQTPERCLGFVEAVVVSSASRGQGYGRKLMEYLIERARVLGVESLHLTSSSSRVAANALYKALGFKLHETNCYHLDI